MNTAKFIAKNENIKLQYLTNQYKIIFVYNFKLKPYWYSLNRTDLAVIIIHHLFAQLVQYLLVNKIRSKQILAIINHTFN